ncbi:HU family DNA-binding protein [Gammaproteobacteria bacterium]|nr:HU family DNA-binding protein [Gammaproteobacteria bacterium]
MNLTKDAIVKILAKNSLISKYDASNILESFLLIIKSKSKSKSVKLSGFGTFSFKETSKRIGRNPKTKESYIIDSRKKLTFKASNVLKKILN